TSDGKLHIMPPTDRKTSSRNLEIGTQLKLWARQHGGLATDPSGGFVLPNGARLAPDAAWISLERESDPMSCPNFVIELLSPSDRSRITHEKMLDWLANGIELGWMIDPKRRTVTIYRRDREPELLTAPDQVVGEGPVAGFVLDLVPVWA
ncbi:MAG: Uma2 family endonuclease, partial [Acidobacteria bacterium]|nr:Uma2 family endonuclease [Acidobacteriota bacterium]